MVGRMVLGRAGSGKTHHCLTAMARLLQDADQQQAFFVLPEQATFIHERMLATEYLPQGYRGGEVTSFRRLIWQAGQRAGQAPLPQLTEAGRSLLMGKIIQQQRPQLQLLGRRSWGQGLAQELVHTAEELLLYGVEPAALSAEAAARLAAAPQDAWARKLADIALLYSCYAAEIAGSYDNFPDGMAFLARQIRENGFLAGASVFVDGYSSFTPREQTVLEAMLLQCARVEIALALDPEQRLRQLQAEDIFYPAWRTYGRLSEAAERLHVAMEPPLCLDGRQGRFAAAPELAFLEQHCYPLYDRASWPAEPRQIELRQLNDRRAEVTAAAGQILHLVRVEGLRFRDISIITRDSGPYEDLLATVFGAYGIPYFIDARRPLLYHPLVELLRSALEIWQGEPRYQAMFRYLKTGLTPLTRDETDKLENYCLAHGIKPWQWLADGDWQWWRGPEPAAAAGERLAEINQLRRQAVAALAAFLADAPQPGAELPVSDLLQALQRLLRDLAVAENLQAWQDEALAAGQGEQAAWHRQALEQVQGFLDEAQLLLAESRLEAQQIIAMLDAGLGSLSLGLIPSGLDQVLVSSLERSRNPELKAAFVLGLNQDILPQKMRPTTLFSDGERQELARAGFELAPDNYQRQMAEHFLAYVALTRSGGRLYGSYCLEDEGGRAMLPSPLVRRLRQLFPRLPLLTEPLLEPAALPGSYATLADLAGQLAAAQQGRQITPLWQEIYHWYGAQEEWQLPLSQLARGLSFEPQKGRLQEPTLQRLYGSRLRSSVSRLEKFRACPFAYFAGYGLKLRQRPIYQITPLERGDIFHRALAEIGRKLGSDRTAWLALTEDAANDLVEATLEQLLPQYLAGILASTARYRYLAERIKHTLVRTLLLMAEHMRRGAFVPVAWELPFGGDEPGALPGLRLDLGNGKILEIQGQIDRVDLARGENRSYLRVIDYKTGDLSLDLEDIFAGLRLQLLVYLQVVLDQHLYFTADDAAAAGIYYLPVRDQLLSTNAPAAEADSAAVGLKLQGLSVLDQEAVRLADAQVNGHSQLIPVALGPNGFYANSPGLPPQRLELLREHLLQLLRQSANQLLAGLVEVAPYRGKNFDACQYCDYQRFCGLDRNLAPAQPALGLSKEQIWQRLEGGEANGL